MILNAGWILAAVGIYGLIHSILAANQFKSWFRSFLGEKFFRYYRLFYNLFAFLSLLPVLGLLRWLPDQLLYKITWPWLSIFLAGETIAIILMGVSILQTGIWSFLGLEIQNRPSILATQGLFHWVRHPTYLGGFLFMAFSPIQSVNLLAFYIGLSLYLIIGAYFEERKLLAEFGEKYVIYRRQTPMFIPSLRTLLGKQNPEK